MSFSWLRYLSDDGNFYATKVDDNYAQMAERGWFEFAAPGDIQYPRGWRLRRVMGLTTEGNVVWADAATVDADIWTGAVSVFTYLNPSGPHVASIIGRERERRFLIPAAAVLTSSPTRWPSA